MRTRLLVSDVDDAGFAEPINGIQYRHIVNADNGEYMLDLHLRQRVGDKICTGKICHQSPLYADLQDTAQSGCAKAWR